MVLYLICWTLFQILMMRGVVEDFNSSTAFFMRHLYIEGTYNVRISCNKFNKEFRIHTAHAFFFPLFENQLA